MDTAKEVLLGGLLYYRSIREKYRAMLTPDLQYIMERDNTPYPMMEGIIRLYVKPDPTIPSQTLLQSIAENYEKLPPQNAEYKRQYYDVAVRLGESHRYSEQAADAILRAYIERRVKHSFMEDIKGARSRFEMLQLTDRFKSELARGDTAAPLRSFDFVRDMRELLVVQPRIPTGLPFFDFVTGGGITIGNHFGLLGPSGGGKTVITCQLAGSLAVRNMNTLILQFEQQIEGNMSHRMFSFFTGEPLSTFTDGFERISPGVIDALQKCANLSSRIRAVSFSDRTYEGQKVGTETIVADIINTIEQHIREGFKPHLILVDWLGAVVENMMQLKGGDTSYPLVASAVQKALMAHGRANGYSVGFFHQTKMSVQEKPSMYKPTKEDAYYYSAFANNLETCLQLGKATVMEDGTQVCYLVNGKSRCSVPGLTSIIRMNGAYSRMEETAPGEYMIGKGGWFKKTSEMWDTNEPRATPVNYEPQGVDAFLNNYK